MDAKSASNLPPPGITSFGKSEAASVGKESGESMCIVDTVTESPPGVSTVQVFEEETRMSAESGSRSHTPARSLPQAGKKPLSFHKLSSVFY